MEVAVHRSRLRTSVQSPSLTNQHCDAWKVDVEGARGKPIARLCIHKHTHYHCEACTRAHLVLVGDLLCKVVDGDLVAVVVPELCRHLAGLGQQLHAVSWRAGQRGRKQRQVKQTPASTPSPPKDTSNHADVRLMPVRTQPMLSVMLYTCVT